MFYVYLPNSSVLKILLTIFILYSEVSKIIACSFTHCHYEMLLKYLLNKIEFHIQVEVSCFSHKNIENIIGLDSYILNVLVIWNPFGFISVIV